MSKFEKLDLMGVASLAAVSAALLAGWIATSQPAATVASRPAAPAQAISLQDDGSMKLTVTAERGDAGAPAATVTRTAASRSSPTFDAAWPMAIRL
jgi:hypothetical protein